MRGEQALVGLDFGEHELRMSLSDDGVDFPATTKNAATASQTCGRMPSVWADALSSSPGTGRGRERCLRDAVGSQRTGGIGYQQSLGA